MKKINKITIISIIMILFLGSCKDNNPLEDSGSFYLGVKDRAIANQIDNYLETKFRKPYNIEVIYRWDGSMLTYSSSNIPPKLELVEPTMDFIAKGLFAPYIEVADSVFMKKAGLRQFVLVGQSHITPNSNDVVSGLADGGVKITLFNVNNVNLKSRNTAIGLLRTLNHEFTHIINQRNIIPKEYEAISREFYTGNTTGITLSMARDRGFVSVYGMNNVGEDFAEFVADYLTLGEDGFNVLLASTTELGRSRINQKLDIVEQYYKSNYDIDLKELQKVTFRTINTMQL